MSGFWGEIVSLAVVLLAPIILLLLYKSKGKKDGDADAQKPE